MRKLIPKPIISFYHLSLVFFAALWYRFPSRSMVAVGVTGTKGKSSTVFMLAKMLEEAGVRVAASSSIMFKIKENEWLNPYHMTMAGRFRLQQFLYQAKMAGCTHVIIETTSEGIAQHRHRFIDFDVAVFTNLSPEHIEAHGGFEKYKQAKGKLFAALSRSPRKTIAGKPTEKIILYNADDAHADYFAEYAADKKYGFSAHGGCTFGRGERVACISAVSPRASAEGISFVLDGISFSSCLLGEFTIENALAAASTARALGVDFKTASDAFKKIEEIPGRMKFVREGQAFTAVIDLAHTPSSFSAAFKAVTALKKPQGRIIAVFGSAGGGRDKWKRPELGKIAARYADYIILTDEDPYDEDPSVICAAISEGVARAGFRGTLKTIQDRRSAIRTAVNAARGNDIVLFLGKGTEQSVAASGKSFPWDEESVIIEEIKNVRYDRK